MKMRHMLACAAATVLGATLSANAQHANFVLFGGGAKPVEAPEQKFVAPLTTPYFHEDSFVTSDLRAWFAYHDFPSGGAIDGGSAKVYALQVRLALTDQLQLVAYKDGYIDFDSGLSDDSGWNDVAAGLKYAFIQDWDNRFFAAAGLGYEIPVGDPSVLQNDDELRAWVSVDKGFDKLHVGGVVNLLCPLGDSDAFGSSTRIIWGLHADYYACEWFSPVVEFSGFHTINDNGVPVNGVDVADLGGGDDVITASIGGELRLIDNLAIRAAYELPLTDSDNDLFGYRITVSAVYSF